MAKGFTVKADVPKKKAKSVDEFNMDEAKALIKGKTVVFCLPGRGVSYIFLKAVSYTHLTLPTIYSV